MGFETIGSISVYTRQLQMFSKWQKKKESRAFRANDGDGLSASARWRQKKAEQDRQFLQAYQHQQEDSDTLLSDIHAKLASGQKLTAEEKAYLREKDPMAYQMLEEEEQEKRRYEADLKRAKTKEDAQRVETNYAMSSLAKVKAVDANPNIPEETKMGIFWSEQRKTEIRAEVRRKFIESGEYAKLPTEAEVQKAREDLKEAERQEQLDRAEMQKEAREEAAEHIEDTEGTEDTAEGRTERIEKPEGNRIPGNAQERQHSTLKAAENKTRLARDGEKRITRTEAENSPEAQKVKRNKLKKKFTEVGEEPSSPVQGSGGQAASLNKTA